MSIGVLSQRDDEDMLHTVAYYSNNFLPAKSNYTICDKEIMVLIKALDEWRPECEGAAHPLQLRTDHKNLQYFM